MQRLVDESEYVLAVLHRMRDRVSADPESFDPGAGERIDQTITRVENALRSARSQLMVESAGRHLTAA